MKIHGIFAVFFGNSGFVFPKNIGAKSEPRIFISEAGWHGLSSIVEEIKSPESTYPKTLMVVLPLVVAIYLLMNIAYLTVLTPNQIKTGDAIAFTFSKLALGPKFMWILPVSVCLCQVGGLVAGVMTGARLFYVGGRRGHLPKILNYVSIKLKTPVMALILPGVLATLYLLPNSSSFGSVLRYFSFVIWLNKTGVLIGVIIFRYKKEYKDIPRPYKINLIFPILGALIALYMALGPVYNDFSINYLYVVLFIASFSLIYFPFVRKRDDLLPENVTSWMAKNFGLAPGDHVK